MFQSILPFIRTTLQLAERFLLQFKVVLIRATPYLSRKRRIDMSYRAWDYNRYSSLEFCAQEIIEKGIPGSVAELGVFQGDFAAKINEIFPEKKLYLFDTFEGFEKSDIETDTKKGHATSGHKVDFSNTSVTAVLNKMKYVKNCEIRKGYFPDTAKGLDDTFSFVSIDADLYKPIYEGLCYFYPRLSKGGYIFVHDYNNKLFTGAKDAVRQFSAETGTSYFPLSDDGGTAIISK